MALLSRSGTIPSSFETLLEGRIGDCVFIWDDTLESLIIDVVGRAGECAEFYLPYHKALLPAINDPNMPNELSSSLGQLAARNLECPPKLREPLGRLALWLEECSRSDSSRALAEQLHRWLGPDSLLTAFRVVYRPDLTNAGKCRYLLDAMNELRSGIDAGQDSDVSREMQIGYWRTARALFLHASHWVEHAPLPEFEAREWRDKARTAYLEALIDEDDRHEIDAHFRQRGDDIEGEVELVCGQIPTRDEAMPTIMEAGESFYARTIRWFLRRYNLKAVWRINGFGRRWFANSLWLAALVVLPLVFFGLQIWYTNRPSMQDNQSKLPEPGFVLLCVVCGLIQISCLVAIVVRNPRLFELCLPRMFFANLLVWITQIIVNGLLIGLSESDAENLASILAESGFRQSILPTVILLSFFSTFMIFLYKARPFAKTRQVIVRGFIVTFIGLGQAIWWSLSFAVPIAWIISRGVPANWTVIAVIALGSSVSLLFSLLAQLLWDDAFIAAHLQD